MLDNPKFTKINDSFPCANCGHQVPQASSTCRDHCPRCLFSLHVDVNPGDRAAQCGGTLKPIGYTLSQKKGTMIGYVCQMCGVKKVNRFLEHDKFEQDSFEALLKLTGEPPK